MKKHPFDYLVELFGGRYPVFRKIQCGSCHQFFWLDGSDFTRKEKDEIQYIADNGHPPDWPPQYRMRPQEFHVNRHCPFCGRLYKFNDAGLFAELFPKGKGE